MSFTTGRVLKVLDRGILVEDSYRTFVRVLWDDVVLEDRNYIGVGSKVILNDDGSAELASSSFNRWRDNERTKEIDLANEITKILEDG